MGAIGSLLGLAVFIGDIWAIVNVFQSRRTSTGAKVVWTALILIMPLVGLVIWFLAGPRSGD